MNEEKSVVDSIKSFPACPGVYQFFSADNTIIYIGKAKSLRDRGRSYLSGNLGHKTQKLMQKARRVEYILTVNEYEALMLEANLIKKYKPRYNILLRDDKSYPYVAVAKNKFPRITLQRGRRDKKFDYFGPYPDAHSVRETIILLQKIFQLRSCSDGFFKNRSRPCLQYQIKRCSAPCVGYVDETAYGAQVKNSLRFMQGFHNEVFVELTNQMQKAAAELHYEEAARIRDQLTLLHKMQEKFVRVPGVENADIIAAAWGGGKVSICVVMLRNSQVMGRNIYTINYDSDSQKEFWYEFLMQYYLSHKDDSSCCSHIYMMQQLPEHALYEEALQSILHNKVSLKAKPPKDFMPWYEMAIANAKNALEKKLSDSAEVSRKLQTLSELLNIAAIDAIECFDISHTSGKETVASCVVCGSYGMEKNLYRSYRIKEAKANDDYGAMREALTIHFKHKLTTEARMPTILLVDGGKGQISMAAQVLSDMKIDDVVLLGIVKGEARKEEFDRILVYPGNKELVLNDNPDVMHLLQQIRNAAHRFAITRHRRKRTVEYKKSLLDSIPGIGEKLKKNLLLHFGGMRELKSASLQSIEKVHGVGKKTAKLIYDVMRSEKSK
jgi:excinuclease ABC subunit C